jgi:hypothetical protein
MKDRRNLSLRNLTADHFAALDRIRKRRKIGTYAGAIAYAILEGDNARAAADAAESALKEARELIAAHAAAVDDAARSMDREAHALNRIVSYGRKVHQAPRQLTIPD